MEVSCIGSDRAMILRVLQREIGERAVYHYAPDFAYTVGEATLRRDGVITAPESYAAVFRVLASMALCAFPVPVVSPPEDAIAFPMAAHSGKTLRNLLSILSARQDLMNRALAARDAFYVSPALMDAVIAHPPTDSAAFLQQLYGRENDYRGISFDPATIVFTGFSLCPAEEAPCHRQLAERIMNAALTLEWVKPYTRRVRNQKYAFRIWLDSIGMGGPEYEQARRLMLGRLYGRSDQRPMPRGK